jgi:hypothetical protein
VEVLRWQSKGRVWPCQWNKRHEGLTPATLSLDPLFVIYGIISYGEIRGHDRPSKALGAQARNVMKMVIWRGLSLALIGVALWACCGVRIHACHKESALRSERHRSGDICFHRDITCRGRPDSELQTNWLSDAGCLLESAARIADHGR